MVKSIKAVLDGIEDRIYKVHEPIGTEMFNTKCRNMSVNRVESHL